MLEKRLRTFYHPERFQGWGRRKRYFEGWYFKLVSADRRHAFAIIPGIAFDKDGNGHSFIQVLDGISGTAKYHRFAIEEFEASSKQFQIQIGPNSFSQDRLHIDLPDLSGELQFYEPARWKSGPMRVGIMGPYAYAPFMECYHGIVSMDHRVEGTFHREGGEVVFNSGRGYTEKDWGQSFPEAYVWMQSNHFSEERISFKASVAKIPWLTGAFTGFIAFLWLKGELILFATYDKGSLDFLEVNDEQVRVTLSNRRYKLIVEGQRTTATKLAAPVLGAMEARIDESMQAILKVTLSKLKTGEVVFEDTGSMAGLEVAGPVEILGAFK